jgi:HK97 family phage portal protein
VSRIGKAIRALAGQQERANDFAQLLGDQRRTRSTSISVTQSTAFRNSVWWACLTLRSDVMSSMPKQVLREHAGGILREVPRPPVLIEPYPGIGIDEYWYSTGMDLDRYGNSISIIRARSSLGLPMILEPVGMSSGVSARMNGRDIVAWRIDGQLYDPKDIWHEKQYTLAGMPLGLSPLAYAAYTLGVYQSAQDFALDWFATGAQPKGVLKNTNRAQISPQTIADVKEQFKAATLGGDIFITGAEWEWSPQVTDAVGAGFLQQQEASNRDVCRYLGVPGTMVDVEVSTGNITYANITQADLAWLVHRIGPAITRREKKWSLHALPQPRILKLNTDSLLRMDPVTKSEVLIAQTNAMIRVPSEVRALDNLPPYTPDQLLELELFARLRKPPPAGVPTNPDDPQPTKVSAP